MSDSGVPKLYTDLQTCWVPRPSPFFMLSETNPQPSPHQLYQHRYFYWDPQYLLPRRVLPCPGCQKPLTRHGKVERPRRVIGLEEAYYLMGVRYKCSNCRPPARNGKPQPQSTTFHSWDSRILDSLPVRLSSMFPAYLTSRSGLDKTAFRVLRATLGNGMGTKPFSDMLSNLHHRRHDENHLIYNEAIHAGPGGRGMGMWAPNTVFPPFRDFSDKKGYFGFIPSSGWLRDLYDGFIEHHRPLFDQHTSMLPMTVGALDHSHKVCISELKLIDVI